MATIKLPGLESRVFDSERDSKQIQIAVLETGCMPERKRGQVAHKREFLRNLSLTSSLNS